jgi:alanine racemase
MNADDMFTAFGSSKDVSARPLRAWIDLTAFRDNLNSISAHAPDSGVLVVIKADAYGHGLVEIARSAGENAEFAVAIPDELKQLRTSGIENRVWVLEGPFSVACLQISENVVWVIHSLWQLQLLKHALRLQIIESVSVCIKLDTGMHRLGLSVDELNQVFDFVSTHRQVMLVCAMTHFAMSDLPNQASVYRQISQFDEMMLQFSKLNCQHSLANSGGVMHYPQSHRDWIRPGIMLYGAMPSPEIACPFHLKAVMHFQSAIMALHRVKKGESVGYGATWTAQRDSLIATVAAGYADGYPRHAVNGTPVAHIDSRSHKVSILPLVGRVSMDMITIDVTDAAHPKIGDCIELWGEHVSADKVAQYAGTIAYDLLTGVSKRVPRIYRL